MDVKVVQGNKRYGDVVVARSTKVTMQGCNKRDAEAMKGDNKKVRDYVSKNDADGHCGCGVRRQRRMENVTITRNSKRLTLKPSNSTHDATKIQQNKN